MSELAVEISKTQLLPKQKYLLMDVCCQDPETEDDVEAPSVRYKFRNF